MNFSLIQEWALGFCKQKLGCSVTCWEKGYFLWLNCNVMGAQNQKGKGMLLNSLDREELSDNLLPALVSHNASPMEF